MHLLCLTDSIPDVQFWPGVLPSLAPGWCWSGVVLVLSKCEFDVDSDPKTESEIAVADRKRNDNCWFIKRNVLDSRAHLKFGNITGHDHFGSWQKWNFCDFDIQFLNLKFGFKLKFEFMNCWIQKLLFNLGFRESQLQNTLPSSGTRKWRFRCCLMN